MATEKRMHGEMVQDMDMYCAMLNKFGRVYVWA